MKYSVRPTTKFQKDLKREEQGSPFGWRLFWLQGMSYHAGLVADL